MQADRQRRLYNLDLLRGLLVFLAMMQHYAGYLVYWYKSYFREVRLLDFGPYQVHADFIGRFLPMDALSLVLTRMCVPWVSMMYITLACVNLPMRSQEQFGQVYRQKMMAYLILFLLFVFENAIVAQSFGQALSLYPIHIWMVILALIATTYRWAGAKGLFTLLGVSMLRFVVPIDSMNEQIEAWLQTQLHPDFRYDAPLDLFLPGACMGALLGYGMFQRRSRMQLWVWLFFGCVLMIVYAATGQKTSVDPLNPFINEHDAKRFLPMLGILGIQIFLIAGALILEEAGKVIKLQPLTWIGLSSLAVFFWHRILFLYVWMPLRGYVGGIAGIPIKNTTLELVTFALLTTMAVYLFRRLKVGTLLFGNAK